MSVTVSKAGPYFASGEIKFSELRRNFRAQKRKQTSSGSESFNTDNNSISASQLIRDTRTSITPIVPDSTENSSIASSRSNWKPSQFRNSIKYYYITHTGTNENFDIGAQSWNSNLNKNIQKYFFAEGIFGSNDTSLGAASLTEVSSNLTLDTYGSILGCGGRGGGVSGAPSISGEPGGNALNILSATNFILNLRSTAKVYAGGGGGERGKTGANGRGGYCPEDCGWRNTYCQGNAPGGGQCPGGYRHAGTRWVRCCSGSDRSCNAALWEITCCRPGYGTSGGTGGAGGNGGPGRGYNYQSGLLGGAPGGSGSGGGGCGAQNGQNGETGAFGGEWGVNGGNTGNSGSGGSFGYAVSASSSSYTVSGLINSSTIKGLH
jgi:hypothetical protein